MKGREPEWPNSKLLELPKNVFSGTYGQNFKFPAAPETHFKSIFKFGWDKSDVCGLGHSVLSPSIALSVSGHKKKSQVTNEKVITYMCFTNKNCTKSCKSEVFYSLSKLLEKTIP